jgi:hypothetical protein
MANQDCVISSHAHIRRLIVHEEMQNVIYQIMHPWHWLTYGQNATAVAAAAACLGLIGLYFYTRSTRTMMGLQQPTARASLTPILVADDVDFVTEDIMVEVAPGVMQPKPFKGRATLNVRNIGQGAALYTRAWCQPVTDQFVANASTILEKTPHANGTEGFAHLLPSETAPLVIAGLNPDIVGRRRILVVETIDATSLRHQLQIVLTPVAPGQTGTEIAMVHADPKQSRKSAKK